MGGKPVVERHHYVPRFYLERFADQKKLVRAYDRTTGKAFSTSAKNLAAEGGFNDLSDALSFPPRLVEDILASSEGMAAISMNEVVRTGAVSAGDREVIAMYMSLQLGRTRKARDGYDSAATWTATQHAQIDVAKALEGSDDSLPASRSEVQQLLHQLMNGELIVGPRKDHLVGYAFQTGVWAYPLLIEGWNWLVVSLSKPGFVTTDHPIAMLGEPTPNYPLVGVGVESALEIWLPLDPRHALVLSRDSSLTSPLFDLAPSHVRAINARLAAESARWVFFRPGTNPIDTRSISPTPPRSSNERVAQHEFPDGRVVELVRLGIDRPHVPNERLLSGRALQRFPRRPQLDGIQWWNVDSKSPRTSPYHGLTSTDE